MYTKRCSKCGEDKEVSEFRVQRDKRDGKEYFRGECRTCISEYNRLYRGNKRTPRESKVSAEGRKCSGCKETKPLDYFGHKQSFCKDCQRERNRERRKTDGLDHVREYQREYMRAYRARTMVRNKGRKARELEWDRLFAIYGCACACCGETERLFLTIDHINGGGNKERRDKGKGNFITWLSKQTRLGEYQILCSNCNSGRHRNGGICPHVKQE